ncbi:MAG: NAD-dependent epimerase/dehydratase family protein [Hyphomicrobiales bacterium]
MQLLVIGGNGFVGSHFVAAAVDGGHNVTVVGRRTAAPSFAHGRRFHFQAGGIAAIASNHALLKQSDVVLHFASSSTPSSAAYDPQRHMDEAVAQISSLLQAMQTAGSDRLVYLSSGGSVYGDPDEIPIPEHHPLQPIGVYGEMKRAIEYRIMEHAAHTDLRPLIIRPSNPYGPGQRASTGFAVVPTFLQAVQDGRPVALFGDGTATRDYVHVQDVARFILMAIEGEHTGPFNVGSGQGTSLLELLDVIERTTGKAAVRNLLPARSYDPARIVLDITKARQQFGWQPMVSLADGIVQCMEDIV